MRLLSRSERQLCGYFRGAKGNYGVLSAFLASLGAIQWPSIFRSPSPPASMSASPNPSKTASRRLILVSLAVAGIFAAYHFLLRALMLRTGLALGDVGPGTKVYRIVPVYSYIDVHWKVGLVAAIVVVVLAGRWLRRMISAGTDGKSDASLVWKSALWFLAVVVAVALIDGGPSRLWRPYELLKGTDYIGAVERVGSPRVFLRDYAKLLPELPDHCRTHPPGGVLFLWSVGTSIHKGPEAAALATICFAALSVPAVFLLGREILDRRQALLATFLFLAAPNVVLFTATCMDAVFLVFFAWTFFLLWRGRRTRPVLFGALGGLAAAVAAFFTFSAAVLALWAVLVWLTTMIFDRARLVSTTKCLSAAAVASLIFYAVLYLLTGYNLLHVLKTAVDQHRTIMSGGGYETIWQYGHLVAANAVAFVFGSGVVLVAIVCWGGGRRQKAEGRSGGKKQSEPSRMKGLFAGCFAATLGVTLALPLYTLEVERIWLFFVPLLAISAVRRLDPETPEFAAVALTTFSLQAVQTTAMEVFLCTIW